MAHTHGFFWQGALYLKAPSIPLRGALCAHRFHPHACSACKRALQGPLCSGMPPAPLCHLMTTPPQQYLTSCVASLASCHQQPRLLAGCLVSRLAGHGSPPAAHVHSVKVAACTPKCTCCNQHSWALLVLRLQQTQQLKSCVSCCRHPCSPHQSISLLLLLHSFHAAAAWESILHAPHLSTLTLAHCCSCRILSR